MMVQMIARNQALLQVNIGYAILWMLMVGFLLVELRCFTVCVVYTQVGIQ